MRTALIAPIAMPVRHDSRGSIEQLVWLQAEELVRLGNEVTLFATGNSETSAHLHATYPAGYEEDESLVEWRFHESMHVAAAFRHAERFDIIHSHDYHFALPFERLVRTPVVHTYHVLFSEDILAPAGIYAGAQLVAISDYQRQCMSHITDLPVVHNGIDTEAFPFTERAGDYLLYLGRLVPWKGPREAIQIAREVGMRLVLAGPGDEDVLQSLAPLIDGETVAYAGSLGMSDRNRLLCGAAALLYPILEPEPFGLVMVEAMACGTPVAALDNGAVPEIVRNGVTGYHAPNVEALTRLVPAAVALDRWTVRAEAVRRFDYRHMTARYLEVYRDALSRVQEPEQ